jgi:hypothetical protein
MTLEDLTWDIGTESDRARKVQNKLEEFMNYVTANIAAIPNYSVVTGTASRSQPASSSPLYTRS